ncbi:hypothetical protein ACI3LX_005251 [Candidozyma auris]|nr:hypothetical protein CAJCM15448_16520 [[Candida] auris]
MSSKRKGYNAIPDLSLANGFLSSLVVQYGHLPSTKRIHPPIPPSLQIQHIQMNPKHALLVGGALYGCGVAYMFRNYYKKSSFRQIYVKADQNYDKVKIMHPPTQASV